MQPKRNPSKPRTYLRGRLSLQFLDDPDTPLIVAYRFGSVRSRNDTETATYACALDNGIDGHEFTPDELEWLESFADEAEQWYESKRVLN